MASPNKNVIYSSHVVCSLRHCLWIPLFSFQSSSSNCRRSSSDISYETSDCTKAQRECRLRPHFSDPMPTDAVKRKQLELKIAAAARQHAQKRRQERDLSMFTSFCSVHFLSAHRVYHSVRFCLSLPSITSSIPTTSHIWQPIVVPSTRFWNGAQQLLLAVICSYTYNANSQETWRHNGKLLRLLCCSYGNNIWMMLRGERQRYDGPINTSSHVEHSAGRSSCSRLNAQNSERWGRLPMSVLFYGNYFYRH